jgi:hypothetical protein
MVRGEVRVNLDSLLFGVMGIFAAGWKLEGFGNDVVILK